MQKAHKVVYETVSIFDFDQTITKNHTFPKNRKEEHTNQDSYGLGLANGRTLGKDNGQENIKEGLFKFFKYDDLHMSVIASHHNNPAFIAGTIAALLETELVKVEPNGTILSGDRIASHAVAIDIYTIKGTNKEFLISYIPEENDVFSERIANIQRKNRQIHFLQNVLLQRGQITPNTVINFYDDDEANCNMAMKHLPSIYSFHIAATNLKFQIKASRVEQRKKFKIKPFLPEAQQEELSGNNVINHGNERDQIHSALYKFATKIKLLCSEQQEYLFDAMKIFLDLLKNNVSSTEQAFKDFQAYLSDPSNFILEKCYIAELFEVPAEEDYCDYIENHYLIVRGEIFYLNAKTKKLETLKCVALKEMSSLLKALNVVDDHLATEEELKLITSYTNHTSERDITLPRIAQAMSEYVKENSSLLSSIPLAEIAIVTERLSQGASFEECFSDLNISNSLTLKAEWMRKIYELLRVVKEQYKDNVTAAYSNFDTIFSIIINRTYDALQDISPVIRDFIEKDKDTFFNCVMSKGEVNEFERELKETFKQAENNQESSALKKRKGNNSVGISVNYKNLSCTQFSTDAKRKELKVNQEVRDNWLRKMCKLVKMHKEDQFGTPSYSICIGG